MSPDKTSCIDRFNLDISTPINQEEWYSKLKNIKASNNQIEDDLYHNGIFRTIRKGDTDKTLRIMNGTYRKAVHRCHNNQTSSHINIIQAKWIYNQDNMIPPHNEKPDIHHNPNDNTKSSEWIFEGHGWVYRDSNEVWGLLPPATIPHDHVRNDKN